MVDMAFSILVFDPRNRRNPRIKISMVESHREIRKIIQKRLFCDLRADTFFGIYLKQQRMLDTAIDDMSFLNSSVQRCKA